MDNYDLSNLPLLGDCANSGERLLCLTDEENRRATFSRRPTTFSTLDQTELQQPSLTYEEQISEQRVLGDFGISLSPNTLDPLIVDEPENPFAALAAYRPLTFDDNSQHPSDSELGLGSGFLEGFTAEDLTDLAAEDLTDIVLAKPEGNDFLEPSVQLEYPQQLETTEQPEQSQDEPDAKANNIPESANPDSVPDKRLGKRRAQSSIEESVDMHFQKILPKPARLSQERKESESSASSQQDTDQNPNESLDERVKRETKKWIVIRKGGQRRKQYLCSYPNCGRAATTLGNLKTHIFSHIRISKYKCTYAECAKKSYFRDASVLQKHMQSRHNQIRVETKQNPNESFGERIKRETEKWVVIRENKQRQKRYLCSYPNCGRAATRLGNLKKHIFRHIHISIYKCTAAKCTEKSYFPDALALERHMQLCHNDSKFYFCALCKIGFGRSDRYKAHLLQKHNTAP